MKKSIFFLGIALLPFSNVVFASEFKISTLPQMLLTTNGKITPLCIAICKGDIEIVKKLIEYGVDVNEKSNGLTPLMIAARSNKVTIVNLLLKNGAHRKEKDEKGYDALGYAKLFKAKDTELVLYQS